MASDQRPPSRAAFEDAVARQVQRLRERAFDDLERDVSARRRAWIEAQRGRLTPGHSTPREAYELLLVDYLGLDLRDVPVVRETEDEIVWRSINPCPTLEACRQLGLDTRVVCRAIYERPTQLLVAVVDPTLIFSRDYEAIRPHADHCLERITRTRP